MSRPIFMLQTYFMIVLSTLSDSALAQLQVLDDSGQMIHLSQPSKRVISLSPGLTELIYAAGGAANIQAVVSYSNYPEVAKKLPQIGSYNALDIEKILLLQPDLIVAWKSGNPKHQIEQLKKLGLTVYVSEPNDFMDIPATIIKLGQLMATESDARKSAHEFIRQFKYLKDHYRKEEKAARKRVFIQIWNNPVMTVNQQHLISKVIALCHGENIFGQNRGLTNTPSFEAILQRDPEIIIATGMAESSEQWLNRWRQWPFLSAVKNNHLYAANPDHLVRHTPRILLGIQEVCQLLEAQSDSGSQSIEAQ